MTYLGIKNIYIFSKSGAQSAKKEMCLERKTEPETRRIFLQSSGDDWNLT